jgi:hypothetical protein
LDASGRIATTFRSLKSVNTTEGVGFLFGIIPCRWIRISQLLDPAVTVNSRASLTADFGRQGLLIESLLPRATTYSHVGQFLPLAEGNSGLIHLADRKGTLAGA